MPDMTISMTDDGSYSLHPPFLIVKEGDREIHWNLVGAPTWQWLRVEKVKGVMCDESPPPPYTPWPAEEQPTLNVANQYVATAPLNGTRVRIYYKFQFTVFNTTTGAVVHVDPDIGNDPQGGNDGDGRRDRT
jgi:hypothetical protein